MQAFEYSVCVSVCPEAETPNYCAITELTNSHASLLTGFYVIHF